VNLDCDESGLKLQAMDSSHVALVSFKIEDSGFVHFRCDRERALGLNMPGVCKVFKLCGNNDSVAIQNEDGADHLIFVFENDEEEKMSTFTLKLMTLDQDALGVPEDDSKDVEIRMPSREFSSIVRTMQEFSDTVRIDVDKNGVKFITSGDVGGGEVLLKHREPTGEDDVGVQIKVTNPVNQTFATRYLNMFAKAGSLSDYTTLCMSEQRPIEVRFNIDDNINKEKIKLGEIKFYLAPKLDDDRIDNMDGGEGNDTNMDN